MKYLSNPHLNTIYIWAILIILAFALPNIFTLTILVAYTGYLPHINTVLWLSVSDTGKKIRAKMEIWHWAILIPYLIFVYSIYARSWSASLLNETFPVDPSKFGITDSIVTVLIAPMSLLYYPELLAGVHSVVILISLFIVPLFGLALLAGFPFIKTLKSLGKLFAAVFFVSFFVTIMFNMNNHLQDIVRNFALNTDFNKHHPCSNEWASKAESLVFLGGDLVYVYFPNEVTEKSFQFKNCDFNGSANKKIQATQ